MITVVVITILLIIKSNDGNTSNSNLEERERLEDAPRDGHLHVPTIAILLNVNIIS